MLSRNEPAVAEIYFDKSFRFGKNQGQNFPAWIVAIEQSGGDIDTAKQTWSVKESSEVGQGWIAVHLNRNQLASDLAMALFVNEHENTDLAIQLFNSAGEVVAVDLFANVAQSMKVAETDYLVIPLQDYEDASTVVVRRISGRVEITGMVLFPVVGAVNSDPQIDAELVKVLGDTPSAEYSQYLQRRIEEVRARSSEPKSERNSSDAAETVARLSYDLPFVLLNAEPKPPIDVYFIPMDFSPSLAVKLAEELSDELNLHIAVSVQMGTSPDMFNSERKQYDAKKIISEAKKIVHRNIDEQEAPYSIVLLHQDLNRPPFNLRYTFAVHSTQGVSVISTARMDPRNYGLSADDELLYSRLKKMVMKGIGYNVFQHKRSLDPSSVMYSPIMSLEDLDEIGTEY
jgi:predicted Zn-dependent protease